MPETNVQTPLTGALDMAKRGFPVHPLHGIEWDPVEVTDEWGEFTDLRVEAVCRCGDPASHKFTATGKHPILAPWGSSTDPAQIRAWAEEHPGCNFGVRLDGHTVIDVDPQNGGADTFNRTFANRVQRTLRVETGGGWHDYFTGEVSSYVLKPGIDVKSGPGHQVVCPGSEHYSGATYRIIDDRPIAALPSLVAEVGRNLKAQPLERIAGIKIASGRHDYLLQRLGEFRNYVDDETAWMIVAVAIAEAEIVVDGEKWTTDRIVGMARAAWKWEGSFRREDVGIASSLLSTITAEGTYIWDDGAELEAIIAGTWQAPMPEYLSREDGQALFYSGRIHFLFGEDSVGKTWVSLALAADLLNAGKMVVHLDWDDDYATNVDRLLKLGVQPEALRRKLYRHRTSPGALGVKEAYAIDQERPDLVIVDVVANALGARDLDENSAGDYLRWATDTAIVWARGGACVVLNDHITKTPNGGWPRGTGAKRGSVDGVAYEVTADPMLMPGDGGKLFLTVQKDRHGGVGVRRNELAATLIFDPDLNLKIKAPRPLTPEERAQVDDLEVIGLVYDHPDLTKTELRQRLGGQTTTKTSRIDGAIERGRIVNPGKGKPLELNDGDELVQFFHLSGGEVDPGADPEVAR